MATTVKGIIVEIEGKSSGLVKSLKQVNSSLADTKNSLNIVESALKNSPENTQLLIHKQDLLTEAIKDTTNKLGLEKKALEDARGALAKGDITQKEFNKLSDEVVKTTGDLEKLKGTSKEFGTIWMQSWKNSADATDKLLDGTLSQLKVVDGQLKEMPTDVSLLTDKSKLLNTAIEQTTKKLKEEEGEARAAELALQMKKIDENQYKAIQQNVQNTKNDLRALTEQANEFGSVEKQQVNAQLKVSTDRLNDTKNSLKAVDDALKDNANDTNLLAQKENLLANAVGETEDKLKAQKKQAELAREELKKGAITHKDYEKLVKACNDTEVELKQIKDAAKDFGNVAKQQFKNTQKEAKGLGDALDKECKSNEKALKAVNDALKDNAGDTKLLKDKNELLGKSVKDLTSKLENQKRQSELLEQSMKDYGEGTQEEFNALQSEIKQTESELRSAQNEMRNFGSVFEQQTKVAGQAVAKLGKKVGDKMQTIGKDLMGAGATMTATVTTPIVAVGKSAVNSIIDFESAFTGVTKTVDETATTTYEDLQESIKGMATTTASSKEEIARIMEVSGQLGISADDITEFTRTMIELGDTTDLSAEEAAVALAQFRNITGETATKDVYKLGSALVDLGNNFETNEVDIMNMSSYLASTAHNLGFSETQILGLSTAMASLGINAEAGGSALSKTFTQFEKITHGATKSAKSQMETLQKLLGARNNKEITDMWEANPNEFFMRFLEGLNKVEKEGGSMTATLNELGLSAVRQMNGLNALVANTDKLRDAERTASKAYKEGNALQVEADKRYGTTASKIQQMKEKVDNLALEFGDNLLPILEKALGVLDKAVAWFSSLDEEAQENVVKFGLVAAAIGPVTTAIGGLTTVGGGAVTMLSSLVSGAIQIPGKMASMTTAIASASGTTGKLTTALLGSTEGMSTFAKVGNGLKMAGLIGILIAVIANFDKITAAAEGAIEKIAKFTGLDAKLTEGALSKSGIDVNKQLEEAQARQKAAWDKYGVDNSADYWKAKNAEKASFNLGTTKNSGLLTNKKQTTVTTTPVTVTTPLIVNGTKFGQAVSNVNIKTAYTSNN
jgi:TP901 family phage tail tape measure protein